MTDIHPTAVVDPKAEIAADVSVGPYSVIGPDVSIGSGTRINPHVVISGPTSIGRDNHIFQFASVGEAPQDKKYAGEPTRLEIGDGNTIRESVTIHRGTAQDQGLTKLGDDNLLMAYSHVAHDCRLGSHIIMANCVTLAGHVTVDDWVIFGGFTGGHQFCRIGAHSFLAVYAGVTRDLPPYVMVSGNPAEPRGINSEGLKRRGFSSDAIRNIKEAYRLLYRAGLRLEEARDQIAEMATTASELQIMVDFLDQSQRSIVR